MDDQKKEENLLDIQIITTFVYIGSLILSIYITYNDKVTIANGKGFLSKKQNQNFSIFNRTLVVVLTLIYLYISYENRKIVFNYCGFLKEKRKHERGFLTSSCF